MTSSAGRTGTTAPGRGRLSVDDRTLTLPGDLEAGVTYDVSFNGQHVWSLVPDRDAEQRDKGYVVAWPKALLRFLSGRADVALHRHADQELAGVTSFVFGGREREHEQVSVTGQNGEALILDKWGRLTKPLSGEGSRLVELLLDEVESLLRFLNDQVGVPAFICYGTLLGAVRDGRLIGHDNDVDVAYLSEKAFPVDVVREGFRVERMLKAGGWRVRRGSGTRLNVQVRLGDGSVRFVDIFTAHWVEGRLYIPSDTGFELPRTTMLPLTTVDLHGRPLPAPADPETLLAATYGEGWRVPDPAFQYSTPSWLSRRLGGWFGGLMARRKHWDSFYAGQWRAVPKKPSPFARWVAVEHPSQRRLVDVGSGTGRDAIWFADHGRPVLGVDFSFKALRKAGNRAERRAVPATFEELNLHDLRAVLALGARLAHDPEPCDVYVRLTLNGLEPQGQENVIRLASMALRRGGLLFLEFRTLEDQRRPHVFAGHSRVFLAPRSVRRWIEAAGGEVVYERSGTGMAVLREEDPHVCRMVARWGQPRERA
jgi:SAM-dependent methyltransferase